MQVSDPNNVKIYNLSAGKSLPEWLSEKKRRALLKKNVDLRKRIELIQDFDMPGVSHSVRVSKDGQYVIATGIYKPRVKCFDVNNLSLKFERCFDAESITFEILSDDYSKLVFLQTDRYIELHVAHGRYYRLRIPKFGRDLRYHYPSCDLFVVGASADIYRLNLERGQFLTPFTSNTATEINKIAINPIHHLLFCGTNEGRVEAWDPRTKSSVGILDCAFHSINESKQLAAFPSITALNFDGALSFGVGTATGQILLYDIRSNKPYYVKDHMYGLPIKDIEFHHQQELVYSMDTSVVKIWNKNTGKMFTSIEATADFNNLCVVPKTGLLFITNEAPKIQTYYIPSLGTAPRWASFLDSLTEELEESKVENVYDDYKFITKQELDNFGLEHLIGTNLLRAYMHGYFMDARLYKKAKSVSDPFEFEEYRKKKIREVIEKDRTNRVHVNKLPQVNKELALKLLNEEGDKKKKTKGNLMEDNRFKALFENPNFEIDKNAEEYRLLNPVVSRLDKSKQRELKKQLAASKEFEAVNDELEGKNSSEESSEDYESDDSDNDMVWTKEVKKQHRLIRREQRARERIESEANGQAPQMFELRQGEEFKGLHKLKRKTDKAALGERLNEDATSVKLLGSIGNREMTFSTNKKRRFRDVEEENRKHREERKRIARPAAASIRFKSTPHWKKKK